MVIWDISLLVRYYDNIDSNDNCNLKLWLKRQLYFSLNWDQRGCRKEAVYIKYWQYHFQRNMVIFLSNRTMKNTKPNKPLELFSYHHYPENNKLCITNCLTSYIAMQNVLVGEGVNTLLLVLGNLINQFYMARFQDGLRANLQTLELTSVFKPHSCRSAYSSKANDTYVSWNKILK